MANERMLNAVSLIHASNKRIAIILPGIGYTCDKPLLYYSAKLAASLGWDVVPVPYGGFPPKVRGDMEKLLQSLQIALSQTEERLAGIDWLQYQDILFISKSIGTAAATIYASKHGLQCRHILFTPVEATFEKRPNDAIAFHGTADPWADTPRIVSLCREAGIPLHITENANHSLETGDVMLDVQNLNTVMQQVKAYMTQK